MELKCNYSKLTEMLAKIAEVVEDPMSGEDLKNAIFKMEVKDGVGSVTLCGINQLVRYRKFMNPADFTLTLTEAEMTQPATYMQIKSKELNSFLNTYKSARRTNVEEVTFTFNERGNIVCKVLETDKDTNAPYVSSWVFNNIPIMEKLKPSLELVGADSTVAINRANIMLATRSLLPVMTNVNSLYGQLNIGTEHVIAFNPAFTTLLVNTMGEGGIFDGIKLSYRAVSFIDSVICSDEVVEVAKVDKYIYFKTSDGEAFVTYDTRLADYQIYVNLFKKDHAICVDRIMLKDILKRLSLMNENVEVTINPEENTMCMRNSKFEQKMDIMQQKDIASFGILGFKIMPDVFNKAIIGSDEEFGSNTYIYYCPQERSSAVIVLADETGSWYTVVRVQTFQRNTL